MREIVTTLLDVVGLLLVAAGAAFAAAKWLHMDWAALTVAGVMVLAGSHLAARAGSRAPAHGRPRRKVLLTALAGAWAWLRTPRGAAS